MKHFHLSFLLALLMSMAGAKAFAQIEIDGIYYNLYWAEAEVTNDFNEYSGDVTIPESVTYYGTTYRVTCIGEGAFDGCIGLTSVTIPYGVTSIGNVAFRDCSALTSVTIPGSVISIGDDAFLDCSGLTSISVASGNRVYDSRNNCNAIIETSTNTLIAGCKNTTIPGSVTSIGDGAFYNCSGLTSVTIPEGVTSIVVQTFYGCSGLTFVTIPEGVTSIGYYAFWGCSGLTDVYCTAITPPSAYPQSFDNDLSNATLHVYASAVDDYKNKSPWSRFGNIVALTDEEIATDILEVKEKREEGKSGAGTVYDLNGRRMNGTRRGMNIVRGSDGTVRKVMVKVGSINY